MSVETEPTLCACLGNLKDRFYLKRFTFNWHLSGVTTLICAEMCSGPCTSGYWHHRDTHLQETKRLNIRNQKLKRKLILQEWQMKVWCYLWKINQSTTNHWHKVPMNICSDLKKLLRERERWDHSHAEQTDLVQKENTNPWGEAVSRKLISGINQEWPFSERMPLLQDIVTWVVRFRYLWHCLHNTGL